MNPDTKRRQERLRGKSIFLSACIPAPERADQYRSIPLGCFEIDQAVISLARAVFSEGGQLVFGGHPSISPLIAVVAGEYREPQYAETAGKDRQPLMRIFQSRALEGYLPDETMLLFRLGYAQIEWTPAAKNEHYNREVAGDAYLQCPASLRIMCSTMIQESMPAAMVCIGGMEGVEEEAALFREFRRDAMLYTLERTGGAASIIGKQNSRARAIDAEVMEEIVRRKSEMKTDSPRMVFEREFKGEPPITPYPLIMQTIVDQIAHAQFGALES